MTSHEQQQQQNNIPDCTLTTACFDLTFYSKNARDRTTTIQSIEELLKIPCFFVIYCNQYTIDFIKTTRNSFGYENITQYVEMELEDIWTYSWKELVQNNREVYFPTKTHRSSVEKHLLCCNKFDFVLTTIEKNPFQTTKFGWLDSNLGVHAKIVCENYSENMIPEILNNLSDKFHIQILNVCNKKFKNEQNKKEFYRMYRWIVCGGFFTCSEKTGVPILNKLKQNFVETTQMGFGHNEEMLYLEILDEFYDTIERSYGDYHHIINNFLSLTKGHMYIYKKIICNYFYLEYWKECIDCCDKMLKAYEYFKENEKDSLFVSIYIKFLLSHVFIKSKKVETIIIWFEEIINSNTFIQTEFLKQIENEPHFF